MKIGRYLLNTGIISSVLGAIGVAKQTKQMPHDWRRYLVWLSWAISFVLTVASVQKADSDKTFIAEKQAQAAKEAEFVKAQKTAAKAKKKAR